jgi:hypothetical protein
VDGLMFIGMLLLVALLGAVVVGAIAAGLSALIFRRPRAAKIAGIVGGLVGFVLTALFFW